MEVPELYEVRNKDWLVPIHMPYVMAFDTEGTGLDPYAKDFRCTRVSWCFPEDIDGAAYTSTWENFPTSVRKLLYDKRVLKLGHNIKYDWHVMNVMTRGRVDIWPFRCSRILWHLLDESSTDEHRTFSTGISPALQTLFMRAGGLYYEAPKDCWFWGQRVRKKAAAWQNFLDNEDLLMPYSAWDAFASAHLNKTLWKEIPTDLMRRHASFLMEMEHALCFMESRGIRISFKKIERSLEEIAQQLVLLEGQIKRLTGMKNVRSVPQLRTWLFGAGGCPVLGRTDKGSPKTGEDTIKALLVHSSVPFETRTVLQVLLDFRRWDDHRKKLEMYRDAADEKGFIHASFRIPGTRTGRLSSVPNMQNPTREGPVRSVFVSRFDEEE